MATYTVLFIPIVAASITYYMFGNPMHHFPDHEVVSFENRIGIPRDKHNRLRNAEIRFSGEVLGPESIAFDPQKRGPYTGVSDGRILRWDGPHVGWSDFAFTSPNWTEECKVKKSSPPNFKLEHVCGRPLGLRFDKATSDLYIADAYMGLLVVSPNGGQAKVLTEEAEGIPLKFANDVEIGENGIIYFTDSSTKYQRRSYLLSVLTGDNTGRLLQYDLKTKKTTVLLRGLIFANGIALNKDHSFLLIAESTTGRLLRYWLKGPKEGTVDEFAHLPGNPDNVRMNENGEFWVALYRRNEDMEFFLSLVKLRAFLLRLPIPLTYFFTKLSGGPHAMVARYSANGELLQILEDEDGRVVSYISEVEEIDGKLWLGSVHHRHIAVLSSEHFLPLNNQKLNLSNSQRL